MYLSTWCGRVNKRYQHSPQSLSQHGFGVVVHGFVWFCMVWCGSAWFDTGA